MPSTKSLITVPIGKIEFTVSVEWSYVPGEPMVRYYPDGSGYPGSPPEFDCVDHIDVIECEWPTGLDDAADWDGENLEWEYAAREDRPDAFAIAERWIWDELNSGAYVDELFDNADDADQPYYYDEDDYV